MGVLRNNARPVTDPLPARPQAARADLPLAGGGKARGAKSHPETNNAAPFLEAAFSNAPEVRKTKGPG